ncbi:MAG: 7-cyano-7-deazaguanine synthase QueC [Bdellovibrionota bacterium]|nr:7-cyano-7-deazaguanine synthase QueC [Bdellovibrionota bacterium]
MLNAVVLLSSGLDSTVNLYEAHQDLGVALALFINYGQRAASREEEMAKASCAHLGIKFRSLDLKFIADFGGSSLTDTKKELATNVAIDDLDASQVSAKNVWVPNRNGILLNVAAGFAEGLGAEYVIPGFNKEEAATFPDNSQGFLDAMTSSLSFSTANQVKAKSYTTGLLKPQIYRRALELKAKTEFIWPCYESGQEHCKVCESCQRFYRAKAEA